MPSTEPVNCRSAALRTSSLRRRKKKSNQRRRAAKKRPMTRPQLVAPAGPGGGLLEVGGDVLVDGHDLGLRLGLPEASVGSLGDLPEGRHVGVIADADGVDLDARRVRLGRGQGRLQLRERLDAVLILTVGQDDDAVAYRIARLGSP